MLVAVIPYCAEIWLLNSSSEILPKKAEAIMQPAC